MNLQKIVAVFSLFRAITPMIVEFVQVVEGMIPGDGKGKEKLALVRAWLEAAFAGIESAGVTFGELWPRIEAMIASLIATYNALGVFRKGNAVPAANG